MKNIDGWAHWLEKFPAGGRVTFPFEEAARKASGNSLNARQALRRAGLAGRVAPIQRGFFAWVPPEYRKDGVPPFYWVIHSWMAHLKLPYYVSLLSAASLLGSAHHAPMEYQVMVNRQLRPTTYGKGRVTFVFRRHWSDARLLTRKSGYQDSFLVSGAELTLVDLVKYPGHAAGWDNIATIAKDLGKMAHVQNLKLALQLEPTPVLQRLGWLFDHLSFEKLSKCLQALLKLRKMTVVPLELGGAQGGKVDERFQLRLNYNPWFTGEADVVTVSLADLLATKVRALYQRRKGRDLFDLQIALEKYPDLDLPKVLRGFHEVMKREGHSVSWREFEQNLQDKLTHAPFGIDVPPLLATGHFDAHAAWAFLAPRLQAAWDEARE